MRIRPLFPLVGLVIVQLCVAGGEGERFKSPSGRYMLCNVGDSARGEAYFELRTKRGDVLFSPKDDPGNSLGLGDRFSSSYAADVMWSPGEEFVLFTFYDGKYKVTAIYSFAAGKLISLGHVMDGWTIPIRWVTARTFIVERHWPMGGQARPQTHYWETYRISANPFALNSIYKSPETREKEQEDAM